MSQPSKVLLNPEEFEILFLEEAFGDSGSLLEDQETSGQ